MKSRNVTYWLPLTILEIGMGIGLWSISV